MQHLPASKRVRTNPEKLDDAEALARTEATKSAESAANARREAARVESSLSQQHDHLQAMLDSDDVEDALTGVNASIDKLSQFSLVANYLELLQAAENLRSAVPTLLGESPERALANYHQLYSSMRALQSLQQPADGAANYLIDYVEQSVKWSRHALLEAFRAKFSKALDTILWPRQTTEIPALVATEIASSAGNLLDLQEPELDDLVVSEDAYHNPPVLLPLQIMVEPLMSRFRFHFSGDRPTNRLEKPEYFLSHVLDLLQTHVPFLVENLQPVVLAHLKDSTLATEPVLADVAIAFINALLPMLKEKVASLLKQIQGQPNHLSHLIHELLAFDTRLRTEWHFESIKRGAEDEWEGIGGHLLGMDTNFQQWLEAEQGFALGRYQSIVEDASALMLDHDSAAANMTTPTAAAIRIIDLLATITSTYRPLTAFHQKLQFLIDIQIDLLDRFHDRLRSALQSFESRTSAVGRTVQGMSAAETGETSGTAGLDRLCRVYGSADYIERALRDWNDDLFFVELWQQLQSHVQHNQRDPVQIGAHDVAAIAAKTSSNLEDGSSAGDVLSGALFEETASSFATLKTRTETLILETMRRPLAESISAYFRVSDFAMPSDASAKPGSEANLAAIQNPLQTNFTFLSSALSPYDLRRTSRALARNIDEAVFDGISAISGCSQAGALQLSEDLASVARIFDRVASHRMGIPWLPKSTEAMSILTLADELPGKNSGRQGKGEQMSLMHAEKRFFASNNDARAALSDLGLSILTVNDARKVIRCRSELSA